MAKLCIIAGHGAGDPGACGGGQTEAANVRALASRIKALGGSDVEVLDTSRNWYADAGINRLTIPKDAALLELHMDGAVETARGGHVIIKSGYEPDAYDKALADGIARILPGRAEKIIKRSNLANVNRAAARGINYRLVECGFISNAEDRAIFNSRMDEIATTILASFGLTQAPSITPSPTPVPVATKGFGGTYRCTVDGLRIRTSPYIRKDNIVPNVSYDKGDEVVLDDWYQSHDGYIWGRYTGIESGLKRYVAVGKPTGKPEPDDYLVRI